MSDNVIRIAPSILAADFGRLAEQVEEAQAAGADLIHIDIMDGRFVPNITMGPLVVEAVAKTATIPLDVHLMIVEPEKFVQRFADSGANSISIHVEACRHLHRALGQITEAGCGAGVALNPHTPAAAIGEIVEMVQVINVMTVNPGFGGQQFINSTLTKIRSLRKLVNQLGADIDIEVDGGITGNTIGAALSAGASVAIAGTCVFQHENGIAAGMAELRRAAAKASNVEDKY
jgi:ribulose-phosphate 3-epimerase